MGATTLPIVNMGDALFHIAWADEHDRAKIEKKRAIANIEPETLAPDTDSEPEDVMDEDEII